MGDVAPRTVKRLPWHKDAASASMKQVRTVQVANEFYKGLLVLYLYFK